jgi:hypothetical protein
VEEGRRLLALPEAHVHLGAAEGPGERVHRMAALGVVEELYADPKPVARVGEALAQGALGVQFVSQSLYPALEVGDLGLPVLEVHLQALHPAEHRPEGRVAARGVLFGRATGVFELLGAAFEEVVATGDLAAQAFDLALQAFDLALRPLAPPPAGARPLF